MKTVIIVEKPSQARDLKAAIGSRFGEILPAEGHLIRLAEPEEVNAGWNRWSCDLLKPDGLYPTRAAREKTKSLKLTAIESALKDCDGVILATDCDREGQLIGQEILEHLRYRGPVRRALFTAQDPKTLRQAFDRLKPNTDMQPLYQAAVARQQADQIFNLSLTRTATKTLLAPQARGVIGIGRVKTPTLAIVCMRELEILNFKPEDYFEVEVTATVQSGSFAMRHAPPETKRIKDKARADAIAAALAGFQGPISLKVDVKRRAPLKLFDLPALQKHCSQRWGWTADRTLSVAQELYDGHGKKLITYPRAEARYLSENQIADVPAIVSALLKVRGFADLEIGQPVIRRGKSGTFSDKALVGVAHHAIIPNVNVLEELDERVARLSEDEKKLFAVICRSYLAAVMPDYEYRHTVVTLDVPVPGDVPASFKATGHVPLRLGWKAVFGASSAQQEDGAEVAETLPPMKDGETAALSEPRVKACTTEPPARYNEGTLIDAMQNAWKFVADPALRDRLKEAKGIGTPATRAEIIKGLKAQNLLAASGKYVIPTASGLRLYELLRSAAPSLVDPGITAQWEMHLDEVVLGQSDFRAVIDGIAQSTAELISSMQQQAGIKLGLAPAPRANLGGRGSRRPFSAGPRKGSRKRTGGQPKGAASLQSRDHRTHPTDTLSTGSGRPESGRDISRKPTPRMVAFARSLAKRKGIVLPPNCELNFDQCRKFLEQYANPNSS
ncbi:DNA topoisomerase [Aquibium sp. ELW1220]|uniref:DNA topoisomerase n=1 Tax=Aquibium sp. ELW1220 TaxID=2976766 RepID=UPI0025AF5730|nr:DNA topoisomerase [Aquibium sp. ELW1220]MDN2584280.1 DNA topoisomerase [Aquibium sp. ELW1220]